MNKYLIICPKLPHKAIKNINTRMQETRSLVQNLYSDTVIHDHIVCNIRKQNPGLFLGTGKVNSLQQLITENDIKNVVIDTTELQPIQQRNLAKLWKVNIIDRTQLILNTFKKHATTYTGKLQVELASLNYQRSRLVSAWDHLEKQRGGVQYIAGPGESQLELDKRMLDKKIFKLRQQLKEIHKNHQLLMQKHVKNKVPLIALTGYTSAGKTTLFNTLTKSQNLVHHQPFTTLYTTSRIWQLQYGIPCILIDTIGFIEDLPHTLIDDFKATLVGLHEADFILHVQDLHSTNLTNQKNTVIATLKSIKIHNPKIINVFNKVDLVTEKPINRRRNNVYLSALHQTNCQELTDLMSGLIIKNFYQLIKIDLNMPVNEQVNWLYQHGYMVKQDDQPESILHFYVAKHKIAKYYQIFQK